MKPARGSFAPLVWALLCLADGVGCGSQSARRATTHEPDAPVDAGPNEDGKLPSRGALGCKPLARASAVAYGSETVERYSWYDADCKLRTAGIVPTSAAAGGGYAHGFTYEVAGRTRKAFGGGQWNGFGYLVNHGNPTVTSQGVSGSDSTLLSGAHHAIHEVKMRLSMAGPVDVTVHWFFATGRSHPIFAITYDATPAGPGVVESDTRSPYGDIAWDEGPGSDSNVDGVSWGDKYRFITTSPGPVTMASSWDYTQPNVVPYTMEWADEADAEMGLVQTQTFAQKPAGGDYGDGLLASDCWQRTSASKGPNCSDPSQTLPHDWLWPFQLNQYELPFTTASHRLAWGSSYGAVGGAPHPFGRELSGYPYLSYAVAIVLGPHSRAPVAAEVAEVETQVKASLSASVGRVASAGPAGVGRSDPQAYDPPGYNPLYGVWELVANANALRTELRVKQGALHQPILHIRDFTSDKLPRVRSAGTPLVADRDYFATLDTGRHELWLTLNFVVAERLAVEIE